MTSNDKKSVEQLSHDARVAFELFESYATLLKSRGVRVSFLGTSEGGIQQPAVVMPIQLIMELSL